MFIIQHTNVNTWKWLPNPNALFEIRIIGRAEVRQETHARIDLIQI